MKRREGAYKYIYKVYEVIQKGFKGKRLKGGIYKALEGTGMLEEVRGLWEIIETSPECLGRPLTSTPLSRSQRLNVMVGKAWNGIEPNCRARMRRRAPGCRL